MRSGAGSGKCGAGKPDVGSVECGVQDAKSGAQSTD